MQINIRETKNEKVGIISDPHFHHNPKWAIPLWKARGYNSVEEHDNDIIDKVNAMFGPNDILFMLGDFCLNTTVDQFNELLGRIKPQIWALWGNHNNPHDKAVYRKAMGSNYIGSIQVEQYPYQYKNMLYLGPRVTLILNGQFCVLDHYPLHVWEEMQHGAWMLCGHSHYGCEYSRAETPGKILDVGWDGHKAPWTFEEIKVVMATKQFVAVDHHRPEMQSSPLPSV